jgi:hypothetical protein
MNDLTVTMQQAITLMKRNGGALHRFPGGFWAAEGFRQNGIYRMPSFGAKTIQGLVDRGIANYTVWKGGRNGRFPIVVEISDWPTPPAGGKEQR